MDTAPRVPGRMVRLSLVFESILESVLSESLLFRVERPLHVAAGTTTLAQFRVTQIESGNMSRS